jgi:hypothetical protein
VGWASAVVGDAAAAVAARSLAEVLPEVVVWEKVEAARAVAVVKVRATAIQRQPAP